jgi:EAL domain-containing protein (putative c-di-GMP-specific phosphodiesterase class I)
MGHSPRTLSKTQLLCLEILGRQASRLIGIRSKHNSGESQSNNELLPSERSFFSVTRGSLLKRLRPALLRNELTLHFQPKIRLGSGHVTGFEALVRWMHPRLGFIGPAEFIPMAETTGQIQPLTLWVLEQSLKRAQQNRWLDDHFQVAVNLSTQNLQDTRLPGQIRNLLDTSGFPAGSLMLEITESAVMSDFSRAVNVLNRLREIGVFLSVDDFGTGYSSLAYLKEMPLHEIKIDRSFITHAHRRERDCAIVRSTVELGHKLGMTVVAEGVEEISTLKTLREVGCDEAQGYAIGPPMRPEQISKWLQARLAETNGFRPIILKPGHYS